MAILGIQNCAVETFGRYEQSLVERGVEYRIVHPYLGEAFPPLADFDALLVGGTPISVHAIDEVPFLRAEHEYLADALASEMACFGICFGGQILARLLGARVRSCEPKEIGGYNVDLTAAGQQDCVLSQFPRKFPVFHWHGDTFDVPIEADLLVEGSPCQNQMFRHGRVIGVQFHLEVGAHEASEWIRAYADELAGFGKDEAEVVKECCEQEDVMARLADQLLANFLRGVVGLPLVA